MKDSISEALGVPDNWMETFDDHLKSLYKTSTSFSDLLLEMSYLIREEEFGENNNKLSQYEKKLLLAGFLVGISKITKLTERTLPDSLMQMLFKKFKEDQGNTPDLIQIMLKKIEEDLKRYEGNDDE